MAIDPADDTHRIVSGEKANNLSAMDNLRFTIAEDETGTPRVDLPEVILEVMSWEPGISPRSPRPRAARAGWRDLDTSITACLAAHLMNVGYRADRPGGRARAGMVPALARLPELLLDRDHRPGQRPDGRPPGGHPVKAETHALAA